MYKNTLNKFYIFIFLILSTDFVEAQQLLVDKVICKVGSEFITLSDIEEEYQYAKAAQPDLTDDARCGLLESAIAQKVLIYQAKLDSVEVSDDEVEQQLRLRFESILRQMNGDEQFFKDYYGATVNEMKDRYRDDQKQKILAERMQFQLIQDISITPSEVKTFFNDIHTDSLPYIGSEVEIAEIMVEPEVNQVEREKALQEAEDLLEQILAGADFAELAKKHSDDIESGKKGGDLGYARRGTYVPEFEAAVFTLGENEISDIIETEYGFHIIQQLKRRGNSVKARHILVAPEITSADQELAKNKLDSIRQLILNDSLTFESAVKKFSLKDLPSYSNNGKLKNPANGTNIFETKDLDPDTYLAIDELKVGGISEVMEVKNFRGEKLYRIVTLQSKSKPHRANLKEDYDKISYFAKESKKSQYFGEWLESRVKETFIKIDPMFEQCPNLKVLTNGSNKI
jgi:peptidyl-prolyl cis-trans isomerase SurA